MSQLISDLAARTGLQEADVRRLMLSAPGRYKRYTIPKRDGTRRPIAQPAREIKAIQRAFVAAILEDLPVHDAAMAYRPGRSIRDNAAAHVGSDGPILKMDLRAFFPSIRMQDWQRYCDENSLFDDPSDVVLSGHLLFCREPGTRSLRLAIGAPSSPAVSNILMFKFDEAVTSAVGADQVVYTRYADDLTFSARRTGYLTGVQSSVAKVIRHQAYPKLEINPAKTTYATKKFHRSITGLTLSNDRHVTLGRDRKRLIRAQVHKATLGQLSTEEAAKLAGMLAFVHAVEPSFIDALSAHYGRHVIIRIFPAARLST